MLANSMVYIHLGLSFLITNWRMQDSINSKALATITLLRVIRPFLEALNFALSACGCLMILEVKNEALEQSLYLKRWHSTLLKLLKSSIIMLLADQCFIKLSSQNYPSNKKNIHSLTYFPNPALRRQCN